jgi:nicotinate phosphoribosyltransferase
MKLFVSGGLTEETIRELAPLVDGYGIGTYISNAPVLDFSMDIVEIEGNPKLKGSGRVPSPDALPFLPARSC